VVRVIPVSAGLIGARLKPPTITYLGWFETPGLASILFGLFILEEAELPVAEDAFEVVIWTSLPASLCAGHSPLVLRAIRELGSRRSDAITVSRAASS
jgi:hypothetical protein